MVLSLSLVGKGGSNYLLGLALITSRWVYFFSMECSSLAEIKIKLQFVRFSFGGRWCLLFAWFGELSSFCVHCIVSEPDDGISLFKFMTESQMFGCSWFLLQQLDLLLMTASKVPYAFLLVRKLES